MAMCLLIPATSSGDHLPPQSVLRFAAAERDSGIYDQAQQLASIHTRDSAAHQKTQSHEHYIGVALSSAGSLANIRDLMDGRAEFAIANAYIANAVYSRPQSWGLDKAVQRLKLVATLQPYVLHIVVRKEGEAQPDLDVLKNARVSIGLPDTQTQFTLSDLFKAHAMPLSDMEVHHFPLQQSVAKLREGDIDALIHLDSSPSPIIDKLLSEGRHALVSLDVELLSRYLENRQSDGLKLSYTSPYAGTPENYVTVAVDSFLLAQDNVSPAIVSPVIAHLREQNERLQNARESVLNPGVLYQMENINSIIPMHDALSGGSSSDADNRITTESDSPPVTTGNLETL